MRASSLDGSGFEIEFLIRARNFSLRCLLALVALLFCGVWQFAQAETLDWSTRPNVSILSPAAADSAVVGAVTITSSGTGVGTVTGTRVISI